LKSSSNELLPVGFVARAHGVRGVVRVRASADFSGVEALWIDDTRYAVRHASRDKEEWLVTLEGVGDRDAADALRGRTVRLERSDIPVADDELLVADLVGCTVVDVAGATIGEVTGSFDSGAHEVLELRGAGGKEILLPLVDAFLVSIDVAQKRIVYDPPEGLLELEGAK
jgi:16S rRNA processing protein RimM